MADILINGKKHVKGKLTITRTLDKNQNPPKLTIAGILTTHRYFEEIKSIETERYDITGVEVFQEVFGSEDFDIAYQFLAKKIDVKGGETCYTDDQISEVEAAIYGGGQDE